MEVGKVEDCNVKTAKSGVGRHTYHICTASFTGGINSTAVYVHCTVGWSDFSFLWNFEKKQVGVVRFCFKKTCFHK